MPLLRAVPVILSAGERTTLKKRVRGAKTAWRDRLRAQIVLAAARGHPNARIAAGLGEAQQSRLRRPRRTRIAQSGGTITRRAAGDGEKATAFAVAFFPLS
jgi:hypothetical protein